MEKLKNFLALLLGYPASYFIGLVLFSARTFICLRHDFWPSFGLLFLVSLIASDIYILIYDKIKIDTMGIEMLKQTGELKKHGLIIKMIVWLNKKGKLLVTIAFVLFEPVMTNIWVRKGHHVYDGDFYDTKAFAFMIISITITSLYWTLFLKSIIHLVK